MQILNNMSLISKRNFKVVPNNNGNKNFDRQAYTKDLQTSIPLNSIAFMGNPSYKVPEVISPKMVEKIIIQRNKAFKFLGLKPNATNTEIRYALRLLSNFSYINELSSEIGIKPTKLKSSSDNITILQNLQRKFCIQTRMKNLKLKNQTELDRYDFQIIAKILKKEKKIPHNKKFQTYEDLAQFMQENNIEFSELPSPNINPQYKKSFERVRKQLERVRKRAEQDATETLLKIMGIKRKDIKKHPNLSTLEELEYRLTSTPQQLISNQGATLN